MKLVFIGDQLGKANLGNAVDDTLVEHFALVVGQLDHHLFSFRRTHLNIYITQIAFLGATELEVDRVVGTAPDTEKH